MGKSETQLRTDFATQIGGVQQQLGDVQKAISDKMAAYEAAGLQRDDALSLAIQQAQAQTQGQITGVQQDVQTKYDALSQGQKDLATQLAQQGFDLNTAVELVRTQTGAGFEDIRNTLAQNQDATQRAIAGAAAETQAKAAAEAEATRQAQLAQATATRNAAARNAANQAKLGNVNSMMQMLGQAGDVGGQQVTVKPADPAKIGYIYDFNSIFANPSQEKMFASPYGSYARGGTVDEVNDELLKLLKG
jgi:hypothetical protein